MGCQAYYLLTGRATRGWPWRERWRPRQGQLYSNPDRVETRSRIARYGLSAFASTQEDNTTRRAFSSTLQSPFPPRQDRTHIRTERRPSRLSPALKRDDSTDSVPLPFKDGLEAPLRNARWPSRLSPALKTATATKQSWEDIYPGWNRRLSRLSPALKRGDATLRVTRTLTHSRTSPRSNN